MPKSLTCTIRVRTPDGQLHNMDDLSPGERKEIGNKLNCQAMEAIGYKRNDNQRCLKNREQVG